jgi:hypothetical protein
VAGGGIYGDRSFDNAKFIINEAGVYDIYLNVPSKTGGAVSLTSGPQYQLRAYLKQSNGSYNEVKLTTFSLIIMAFSELAEIPIPLLYHHKNPAESWRLYCFENTFSIGNSICSGYSYCCCQRQYRQILSTRNNVYQSK